MQVVSTKYHEARGQIGVLFDGFEELLLPWKVEEQVGAGGEAAIASAISDQRTARYIAGELDAAEDEVLSALQEYRHRSAVH